ncbi:MAG: cyclase family protein [Xanthomonadales bacterium]|nr:cyclase family protein [Xanthomonadales bacterium]
MKKIITFLLILSLSFLSNANGLFTGEWIDLTHDFSEEAIYWPTAETFKKKTVYEGQTDAGYFYSAFKFSAEEHGGTHIDAPIHFVENRKTVDQIPIEQLIAPGVVIRITDKTKENRNYQLSIEDILNWEKLNGKIPENSIVLIDTGSSKFWPNRKKYMGTDERGPNAVAKLSFPGIHPHAAEFLATRRKINALGIDSPSIDFGGSKLFRTHRILFNKNIPGLENVANLDKLPAKGFMIIALPMKIKGGSGSPLRIVAFIASK